MNHTEEHYTYSFLRTLHNILTHLPHNLAQLPPPCQAGDTSVHTTTACELAPHHFLEEWFPSLAFQTQILCATPVCALGRAPPSAGKMGI